LTGFLAGQVPRTLAWLEEYFGTPYPYPKLDFIVVPEYAYGAMENPGAVVARPELALIDPASATPSQKGTVAHVLAHELAHMWFGDMVTMQWWDDFWLNEAFAEWVSRKAMGDLWPDLAPDFRDLDLVRWVLAEDGLPSTRPVRVEVDPAAVFETSSRMATDKGAVVLAMMEAHLGAEAVQEGVRAYLSAHEWKNATASDLFSKLGESTGQDVEALLTPFLDQPGAPLVKVVMGEEGKVTLRQTRYGAYGVEVAPASWQVPMTLKYADAAGVHTHSLLLTEAEQVVDLGETAPLWVFPNANGVGYFAWSQPPEALETLVAASSEHLSPLERAALLHNLALLRDSGEIKGGDLLRLLLQFEGETEPSVVARLLRHLRLLEEFAPEEEEGEEEGEEGEEEEEKDEDEEEEEIDPVKAYVHAMARPALDQIGFEQKPGEAPTVIELRPKLLHWLGHLGEDEEVIAWARKTTASFFRDGPVPPSLARVAVLMYAEGADTVFQDKMIARWRKGTDPKLKELYLAAMATVSGAEPRDHALAFALSEDLGFYETLTIVMHVLDEEENRDAGLEWGMAHHDEIAGRLPPTWVPHLARFGEGCSMERFEKAKAFYGDPARAVTGTDQHIAEVGESVAACVAQKELHGPSVAAFLEEYKKAVEEAAEEEE
jgi:alanyl aminopeptidase